MISAKEAYTLAKQNKNRITEEYHTFVKKQVLPKVLNTITKACEEGRFQTNFSIYAEKYTTSEAFEIQDILREELAEYGYKTYTLNNLVLPTISIVWLDH